MNRYDLLKNYLIGELKKKIESLKPEEMYGFINVLRDDGIININPDLVPDYVFCCEKCQHEHNGECMNDMPYGKESSDIIDVKFRSSEGPVQNKFSGQQPEGKTERMEGINVATSEEQEQISPIWCSVMFKKFMEEC